MSRKELLLNEINRIQEPLIDEICRTVPRTVPCKNCARELEKNCARELENCARRTRTERELCQTRTARTARTVPARTARTVQELRTVPENCRELAENCARELCQT
ncbi:MAG: hypothetical protein AB1349_13345 [Elusimicrobiota bacterium]